MGSSRRAGTNALPATFSISAVRMLIGNGHAQLVAVDAVGQVVLVQPPGDAADEGVVELAAGHLRRRLRVRRAERSGCRSATTATAPIMSGLRGWRDGSQHTADRRQPTRVPASMVPSGSDRAPATLPTTPARQRRRAMPSWRRRLVLGGVDDPLGLASSRGSSVADGMSRRGASWSMSRSSSWRLHPADAVGDGVMDLHDDGGLLAPEVPRRRRPATAAGPDRIRSWPPARRSTTHRASSPCRAP